MLNDTGDGAALMFSSAVEAYSCAEYVHRRAIELNASMTGTIVQWCFRVGVARILAKGNIGDIMTGI